MDASTQFDVISAKQTENVVQEANRVTFLICVSARRISSKIRSFDLGKDAIQVVGRRVEQSGEEFELQIQEFPSKAGKVLSINKQAAYDEDGLIIWPGWIAKFYKISSFVDVTDFQQHLAKKAMATMRWPWGPPPAREYHARVSNWVLLKKE